MCEFITGASSLFHHSVSFFFLSLSTVLFWLLFQPYQFLCNRLQKPDTSWWTWDRITNKHKNRSVLVSFVRECIPRAANIPFNIHLFQKAINGFEKPFDPFCLRRGVWIPSPIASWSGWWWPHTMATSYSVSEPGWLHLTFAWDFWFWPLFQSRYGML